MPYQNKPILSHIMDKFDPVETHFVIACGHLGGQVKDYISLVHKDKHITCVDIQDYSESTTGPATSILQCSTHLSEGFLWISCDTIFDFDYSKKLDHNWIAVHPVDSTLSQDYCWVCRNGTHITSVENKQACNTAVDAFIGVMYCKDTAYLDNLSNAGATQPHQGFAGLDLQAHTVENWLDFGTYAKWQTLNIDTPEIAFGKPDELFYVDNNKIIKFNTDSVMIEKKLLRSQLNPQCMPSNVQASGHFISYDKAQGDTFYFHATPQRMEDLLEWFNTKVWHRRWFPDIEKRCRDFYQEKTQERVKKFRSKYPEWEEPSVINGTEVRSISEYLSRVDWDLLCNTTAWGFIHGDGHWDNIIYNPLDCSFTAIDWRTDFAGSNYGDIYYDLAKMACGIYCNFHHLKNNTVEFIESTSGVNMTIEHVEHYELYQNKIRTWCDQNQMSWNKVSLLVPLIYLNISSLHAHPYDKFLFCLAQLKFSEYFHGV
jgi:hypothetical protein